MLLSQYCEPKMITFSSRRARVEFSLWSGSRIEELIGLYAMPFCEASLKDTQPQTTMDGLMQVPISSLVSIREGSLASNVLEKHHVTDVLTD